MVMEKTKITSPVSLFQPEQQRKIPRQKNHWRRVYYTHGVICSFRVCSGPPSLPTETSAGRHKYVTLVLALSCNLLHFNQLEYEYLQIYAKRPIFDLT